MEAVLELGALGLAPKPSPDAASSPVLYLHRQQGYAARSPSNSRTLVSQHQLHHTVSDTNS